MKKLKAYGILLGIVAAALVIALITVAVLSPFRLAGLILEYGGKAITAAGGALTVLVWKACGLTTMKFLKWGEAVIKRTGV
jgi:hypothetical protein